MWAALVLLINSYIEYRIIELSNYQNRHEPLGKARSAFRSACSNLETDSSGFLIDWKVFGIDIDPPLARICFLLFVRCYASSSSGSENVDS